MSRTSCDSEHTRKAHETSGKNVSNSVVVVVIFLQTHSQDNCNFYNIDKFVDKGCLCLNLDLSFICRLYVHSISSVNDERCVWVGAANSNNNHQYKWIELPPNYNQSNANGELLSNTYSNFQPGEKYMQLCLVQ